VRSLLAVESLGSRFHAGASTRTLLGGGLRKGGTCVRLPGSVVLVLCQKKSREIDGSIKPLNWRDPGRSATHGVMAGKRRFTRPGEGKKARPGRPYQAFLHQGGFWDFCCDLPKAKPMTLKNNDAEEGKVFGIATRSVASIGRDRHFVSAFAARFPVAEPGCFATLRGMERLFAQPEPERAAHDLPADRAKRLPALFVRARRRRGWWAGFCGAKADSGRFRSVVASCRAGADSTGGWMAARTMPRSAGGVGAKGGAHPDGARAGMRSIHDSAAEIANGPDGPPRGGRPRTP